MAFFFYPMTANYVPDWTVQHALREIVSNGLDAELEFGAKFTLNYKPKTARLSLRNESVKLPPEALYFGESTKTDRTDLIGQYGEGLKLALLVFARKQLPVTIRNGADETWKPMFKKDKRGLLAFAIDITPADRTDSHFEVIIDGVTADAWEIIQSWFLRLSPPPSAAIHAADAGELIDDPAFAGRIFNKGVYVATRSNYKYGYNFKSIDIGRDRKVPSSWYIDDAIRDIWNELSARDDAKLNKAMWDSLNAQSAEQDVFAYSKPQALGRALAKTFVETYGTQAVPVKGSTEGSGLQHVGISPVPLPPRLVDLLRQELPTPEKVAREFSEKVVERLGQHQLSAEARANLIEALELLRPSCPDIQERVIVVRFGSDLVEGLHVGKEICIAEKVLENFGKTLTLLVHEFAHDAGGDGDKSHVDAMHQLHEETINRLWAQVQAKSPTVQKGTDECST